MLSDAVVERTGAGSLLVSWAWIDPRQHRPVEVSIVDAAAGTGSGPRPERRGARWVVEASDSLQVEIDEDARPLLLVAPVGEPGILTMERRVALPGTLNFRDLGGYPGEGGRRIRWGKVYRSDNLAQLDHGGTLTLASLGLRSVYDLRHPNERQRDPSRVPVEMQVTITHLPIGGEAAEAPDVVTLLTSGAGEGFGLDFMIEMNITLLTEHAAVFGRLLGELAQPEHLPAVFHCTAGKDRTGVGAALLLSALGVDRQTVLDDYELTTTYRSEQRIAALRPRLEEAGVDVEQVRPFLSAPRPALAIALDRIDCLYGSVPQYLTDAAGVSSAVMARLQSLLLD